MMDKEESKGLKFQNIKITLKIYALVLAIFFLFRLVLFLTQVSKLGADSKFSDILYSFFMGVRFDTVIAGYILFFTFLLLSVRFLANIHSRLFNGIIFWYTYVMFVLTFLVCAADIPFFDQFYSRFSVTAFEWVESPLFVIKMIFESPSMWIYFIPLILFAFLFYKGLRWILKGPVGVKYNEKIILQLFVSILFLGIIFLGVRGRIDEKSPIRVGTAYFGNDPLLNKLGLNPNFTLMRSYLDSKNQENKAINFMSDEIALSNTQKYLEIEPIDDKHPLLREIVKSKDSANFKNVVLVLMEGMPASNMSRHGNTNNLTPFLDSISQVSYYFDNCYSSGLHTFNGVYSALFSNPALFRHHPMKGEIYNGHGIASSLRKLGYSTSYFTTHDAQFDNIEGFLRGNDFENIISKVDYPSDKVKTTLGVPDDYMFEYSMPILDELAKDGKPFLSVFLTASNHKPYYLPDYFQPKQKEISLQMIEYSDYALKKLIEWSSKKKWFKNTLFVFIADHGALRKTKYDLSVDYNHVPLIFYAPGMTEGKTFSGMAGQIDVYPSIMGLLNLSYNNTTLGIDLFSKSRPYMYFNVDDKIGVIDHEWLLIIRKDQEFLSLYKYTTSDVTNYADQRPEIVEKMKNYAESQMQAFQYMLKHPVR